MNMFIISTYGDSLDLAEKLQKEGHQVSIYIKDKNAKLPKSDVDVVKSPASEMLKAELSIIEDPTSSDFVERARKLNKLIVGGGKVADRLINDPTFGTEVLLGCGLKLAKQETQGMLLEVGGWFSNSSFLKPYFLAFKYMKFGAGDIGPELGPMGIIGTYKLKGKIFRDILRTLEPFLKSINYIGYIGIDVIINNDNIQAVGWQPGLAFPTVNIISSMQSNIGSFLCKLSKGQAKITPVQPDKVGIGVTWFKLPWIYENPVKNRPRIICESGGNIEEARSKVCKTIHKTLEPDAYYRSDLGSHTKDEIKNLMSDGWL